MNLLREQAMDKGRRIERSGVDTTRKIIVMLMLSIQTIKTCILIPDMNFWKYNARPLMDFQFHIYNVSFDNEICAQSIVYPNKKWKLKRITTKRSPSMSSRMRTGAPNMVCYFMKKCNLCTDKTNETVIKTK